MKSQVTIETDLPQKTLDLVKAMQNYHGDPGHARIIVQCQCESSELERQLIMLFPGQAHVIRTVSAETKALPAPEPAEVFHPTPSESALEIKRAKKLAARASMPGNKRKQLVCAGCGAEITSPLSKAIRCSACLKAYKAQPANCLAFNGQFYAREYLMSLLNKNTFQPGTRFTSAKGKVFAAIKDSKQGWQLQKV